MKKALLIGIDYIDVSGISLKGCINDTINMRNMLIDAYDYDTENIVMLRDDDAAKFLSPTYYNIYDSLLGLVLESSSLDEIWLHYSGHGSQIQNQNCDLKKENHVEAIVPVDYLKEGCIVDCDLYDIIRRIKCIAILTFDCCHSGTICDMPYTTQYDNGELVSTRINKLFINNKNIFVMSGCRDDETSADTTNIMDQRTGAFTNALCECLRRSHHNTSILSLHKDICIYLEQNGYNQQPILSSTVQVPLLMFLKGEKKKACRGLRVSQTTNDSVIEANQIVVSRKPGLLHQYIKKNDTNDSFSAARPSGENCGKNSLTTFIGAEGRLVKQATLDKSVTKNPTGSPTETSASKKIRYNDEIVIRGLLPFISSGFSISSLSSSETSSVSSACRHFYNKPQF